MTVVIYHSQTGFTKKYAEWISEELECEMIDVKDFAADRLNDYETIIYGGNIVATKIMGLSLINNNLSLLKDKDVYIFGVGITPYSKEYEETIAKNNLTGNHQLFYFTGGLDKSKLKGFSKFVLSFIARGIRKKKEKSKEEEFFLEANSKYTDTTSKEQIKRLIDLINEEDE